MPAVPNPFYASDWAERHPELAAEAARLAEAAADIAAAAGYGAPAHLAALERQRAAKRAADEALWGQFETVGDYAFWRFCSLPPGKEDAALLPDFDGFLTIEEADAAYQRAHDRLLEPAVLDKVVLPTGQPPGLAAFGDARRVVCSPRRFEGAELGAMQGVAADDYVDCVVSFQELEGVLHFCVAHRWGALSPGSRDQFRNIATVLARQAIAVSVPEAGVVFTQGKHASPAHRELIRQVNAMAGRLRFYRHALPRRDLREEFCRVDMAWNGTRFIDPDFESGIFSMLPAALRDAAENFAPFGGGALAAPRRALEG
jgi:hypothetical protein